MLKIDCPYCGPRNEDEFHYMGDATITRPKVGNEEDVRSYKAQNSFFNYVYIRDNPSSWHKEIWQHLAGCRRYIKVERHITSHDIKSVSSNFVPNKGKVNE